MACDIIAEGRYAAADGDLDACIRYQKENGRAFATLLNNQCYGSSTCDNVYGLIGAVNYEIKYC